MSSWSSSREGAAVAAIWVLTVAIEDPVETRDRVETKYRLETSKNFKRVNNCHGFGKWMRLLGFLKWNALNGKGIWLFLTLVRWLG